jgi:hypothetical protein
MDYNGMGFAEDMMYQQQMMQDQFMQQQMMNQQMMQEQQMINQQQLMNQAFAAQQIMYDKYGNPKRNKQNLLKMLENNLQMYTGCPIMDVVKIDEQPNLVRHCCVQCGISQLPKNEYPIPELNVSIPYYFCKGCGKLFIYNDFM